MSTQITLEAIRLFNFKGLKDFELIANGQNATIKGANGTGKTTVYDGFLWLLFGKDSTGRTDFAVRPLDLENQPIKGLDVTVEVALVINGVTHVLRKTNSEHHVKEQLRGYTTSYWVDDVPKKAGEFAQYVGNLVPEDTFKLLANLRHFNEALHWSDQRSILLDVAGDIGGPVAVVADVGAHQGVAAWNCDHPLRRAELCQELYAATGHVTLAQAGGQSLHIRAGGRSLIPPEPCARPGGRDVGCF